MYACLYLCMYVHTLATGVINSYTRCANDLHIISPALMVFVFKRIYILAQQIQFIAANYYFDAMRDFLDSPFGQAFKDNVVWKDESTRTEILNSRVVGFHVPMANSYENVDALEEGTYTASIQ
jgi:hypothetical protein